MKKVPVEAVRGGFAMRVSIGEVQDRKGTRLRGPRPLFPTHLLAVG